MLEAKKEAKRAASKKEKVACKCRDVERKEEISICETDRK